MTFEEFLREKYFIEPESQESRLIIKLATEWHSQELDQRLAGVKEVWLSGKFHKGLMVGDAFNAISNLAKESGWGK